MAEYINKETAIAKLTALEVIEPNATMTDAKRVLADIPNVKVVSLHDIYRVIAGHSYYHGDRILAALTCITEGKEVNPVRPTDLAPVVYGKWIVRFDGPYNRRRCYCSHCGKHNGVGGIAQNQEKPYCPNCGAKMDKGDNNVECVD